MRGAVVVVQPDRERAEQLAARLKPSFCLVFTARSIEEVQKLASRYPLQIGVVDLGLVPACDVHRLRTQLGIEIICTHRLADDAMWAQALDAGALDCCYDDDAAAMIRAVGQLRARKQVKAAAA